MKFIYKSQQTAAECKLLADEKETQLALTIYYFSDTNTKSNYFFYTTTSWRFAYQSWIDSCYLTRII